LIVISRGSKGVISKLSSPLLRIQPISRNLKKLILKKQKIWSEIHHIGP
jgi:hypothetical protein